MQVDASRSTAVVVIDLDDESINSEESRSLSSNDNDQIAPISCSSAPVRVTSNASDRIVTDVPINCSTALVRAAESPDLTSEESKSIEESAVSHESLDSGTVSSPNISLLTGSQNGAESDVHSSPEKSSSTE